jgi:hypothetical protein
MANYTKEIEIYNKAKSAANEAVEAFEARHPNFMDCCGFAWVHIAGATRFVNALKSIGEGSKAYRGGYQIWNPSDLATQSMSIKEAGADAFARVLQENDIKAYSQSRMD